MDLMYARKIKENFMEGDKMRLQGLLQPLQQNDKFIKAIDSIKNDKFPINISGLSDSGKSYIIEGIFKENNILTRYF